VNKNHSMGGGEKILFLVVWLVVWFALNMAIAVNALRTVTPISVTVFLMVQFLNLGISYGFVQWLFSLFSKPMWPQRLDSLSFHPRVAVLYTTCDDYLEPSLESLSRLRYPNYDVFVLDDSRTSWYRAAVMEAAEDYGFRVIHRTDREGFKAGALNKWLSLFAEEYDYFVIVDADSILPEDFIECMMLYAEHPNNGDIAVFQSKLAPWNTDDYLSIAVTGILPITLWKMDRLLNRYDYLVCWGHNALFRTKHIVDVGGFSESFSSEDLALAIDLANSGYRCCLVDVLSFEKFPRTFEEYARRGSRWARQAIQLLLYKNKGNLSLTTIVHLFMDVFGYIMPILFAIGAVLLVWSGNSSLHDLAFAVPQLSGAPNSAIMFSLVCFYVVSLFLDLPAAVLMKSMSIKQYFLARWLHVLLGFYSLAGICKGLWEGLVSRRPSFEPTGSSSFEANRIAIFNMLFMCIFVLVLAGGILRNPAVIVLNWFWIIPILITPAGVVWIGAYRMRALCRREQG